MSKHEGAPGTACPKPEELSAFAAGRLVAEARELIASHIEACAACLASLQGLHEQEDPLLADLRKPLPPELFTPRATGPSSGAAAAAGAAPSTRTSLQREGMNTMPLTVRRPEFFTAT